MAIESGIYNMDCLEGMRGLPDDCIDLLATDPPFGISFMGRNWDRAVPSVEIWKECYRVLKPGGFAFVKCLPRLDCQIEMGGKLRESGFRIDFTPIYWCFASGLPKAMNIGKAVDKRLGYEREVIGQKKLNPRDKKAYTPNSYDGLLGTSTFQANENMFMETAPASEEAKYLDGSYTYSPKPAVEVILVAMKPFSGSYIDQALAYYNERKELLDSGIKEDDLPLHTRQGLGSVWFGDCMIPFVNEEDKYSDNIRKAGSELGQGSGWNKHENKDTIRQADPRGRFPANLLVSDSVLDDGIERKSTGGKSGHTEAYSGGFDEDYYGDVKPGFGDAGSFSRYFDLDKWYEERIKALPESARKTFPFLIISKASRTEKDAGLDELPDRDIAYSEYRDNYDKTASYVSLYPDGKSRPMNRSKNNHPTVTPVKLFSYLVVLGSREGDIVLDPFAGSGSCGIACIETSRRFILYEIDSDYFDIATRRVEYASQQLRLF